MTNPSVLLSQDSEPPAKYLSQENASENGLCSQDFFCSPDFLTPADDQFSLGLEDHKDEKDVRFSSIRLSPVKKRPSERHSFVRESEEDEEAEFTRHSTQSMLPPLLIPLLRLEKDKVYKKYDPKDSKELAPVSDMDPNNSHSPQPHHIRDVPPVPVICYKRKRKTLQNISNKRQKDENDSFFKLNSEKVDKIVGYPSIDLIDLPESPRDGSTNEESIKNTVDCGKLSDPHASLAESSPIQDGLVKVKVPKETKESGDQFKARIRMLRKSIRSDLCLKNPFLKEEGKYADVGCNLSEEGQKKALQNLFSVNSFDHSSPYPSRYRNDFHELKVIGCGSFSLVSMVRSKIDGCLYAIKRSNSKLLSTTCRKNGLLEVQAMASAGHHPNIIRYHTSWCENDYIYIQLELCKGNLSSLLESGKIFNEDELMNILKQMGKALHFLHDKGICHLDIKPDNIFATNDLKTFKLGDFGRARLMDGSMDVEEGDARYIPPELLQSISEPERQCHLAKADIFSLGASIYELALGKSLPSFGMLFSSMRKSRLDRIPTLSLDFHNLLLALMNPEPQLRPSASDLLNHHLNSNI